MSTQVFPTTNVGFSVIRQPEFKTRKQVSISGFETAINDQYYPRYTWTLLFEVLRQGAVGLTTYTEFSTLLGFFNLMLGGFDTFLYQDQFDYLATAELIGVGDNVTTQFQLISTFGGFVSPVFAPKASPTPQVFITDSWQINVGLSNSYGGNLLEYSSEIGTSPWITTNIAATVNYFATPSAKTDGTYAQTTGSVLVHRLTQPFTWTNTPYTVSFLARYQGAPGQWLQIQVDDSSGNNWANFDCLNGTIGHSGSGVTSVSISGPFVDGQGSPNWYRIMMGCTPAAGAGNFGIAIINTDQNSYNPTCDGTANNGPYLWGAQVVLGTATQNSGYYWGTLAATIPAPDFSLPGWGSTTPGITTIARPLVNWSVSGTIPSGAATLKWTGQFYWPVRFVEDKCEFEQFDESRVTVKKLAFKSILY